MGPALAFRGDFLVASVFEEGDSFWVITSASAQSRENDRSAGEPDRQLSKIPLAAHVVILDFVFLAEIGSPYLEAERVEPALQLHRLALELFGHDEPDQQQRRTVH